VDFFLENYSRPPIRAEKTHEANQRVAKHLKEAFRSRTVGDITADDIELYLRRRLQTRVRIQSSAGIRQKDRLKPSTVHQELRVLRRVLNVAVRKRLLPANPCAGVEFPVKVVGMFRPHYMSWSEQQSIEFQAPDYRQEPDRLSEEPEKDLECGFVKGKGTVLSNPRSAVDLRDSFKCGWRSRRMGHAVTSAGRCEGVQEVLADETANEEGGTAETEQESE
jgi:hypothetical protein